MHNCEIEKLKPSLIEKLGTTSSKIEVPNWTNFEINFKPDFLEKFNPSSPKVAILVTNEFEGFSKNGGIGTYYTTLSQKLAMDGWYVILLLCQTEENFQGEAKFPHVDSVFSTHEAEGVLSLQPIHLSILAQTQQQEISNSFDYESYCCLFFTQAIIASFPDAVTYIEFPDIWGFGYRTTQAKKTGLLSSSCLIGATTHGCFEWLREVNSQYSVINPQWLWLAYHYEQYSYENADVAYFPSYFLKSKLESYGWVKQGNHLPYFVPIVELQGDETTNRTPPTPLPKNVETRNLPAVHSVNTSLQPLSVSYEGKEKFPVVFFGRLEERKGFCTFVEAIKLLNRDVIDKIQIIFIGKIIPLQSSQYQHLDSQQYIEEQLDGYVAYKVLPNLSSQEAIKFVRELNSSIVCLTSLQENFPNTGLEMGQLPVSLVVSDTGGFRETLNLIERSDCVRYFQPGNSDSLAQTITQAVDAYPENPLIPEVEFLEQVNRNLLNQRLEYMSQVFMEGAPKELSSPPITIAIVCSHPTTAILKCLESLATQTYNNFEIIVGYPDKSEFVQEIIIQAQTKFPSCKYLNLDASWSLGESYNYLVELAAGEYVLQLSPEHIPLSDTVEKFVTAALTAQAHAVVSPQVTVGEDGTEINLIDGCLLKLLEFNYNQDISALYSLKLLKEFPYSQERGIKALNWHIIAAAIATGKEIAYYPYPLYTSSTQSTNNPINIAKERYYIRQYLYQIESSKWNQRQLNLLLTGVEQLLQQPEQNKSLRFTVGNGEKLSSQSQAWMLTAQQIQDELTHTQETLKNLQSWNQQLQKAKDWLEPQLQTWMQKAQQTEEELTQTQETLKNLQSWNLQLQAGKDWLETQWQTWMLRTQKAELEWQRWQSIASMMANSKFWHLRKAWLKLKNIIKTKIDPLELASQVNSEKDIRDYVTTVATQKVRYFQPEAVEKPVVSIISVFFNDYEFFETTYRSVINQTWQNFEWIIVNDGSTSLDAVAFIESLPQRTKKIKVVSNSNNQGEAAARNMAIAEAQGEYLLFVNLVDIIDPLYIEKSLLFLETHPEFSFVNSYSAVFQAQEYWWNHGFNKPAKLIQENFVKGQLLYRKADFDELGGFDNELKYHADWERWVKAIANHQKGWTIPEYLECSRCTNLVAPAFEQNRSESKPAKELIQSRYREFFTSTPPQDISLNGESLNQQQLQLKIDAENSIQYSSTNKNLLFFFSSLNSDIDKCNLELITRLEQQDYKITAIATTKERASKSFYNVTPDIFHLPNFLDEAYWLAFTRYIIEYRQINTIIISHVDIAYYFLPLLRAEFPQVAFIDLGYNNSNFSSNGNMKSSLFSKYLDRQVLFSPSLDNIVDQNSKLICSSNLEIEAIFNEAIQARQKSNPTEIDTELATVALPLILK